VPREYVYINIGLRFVAKVTYSAKGLRFVAKVTYSAKGLRFVAKDYVLMNKCIEGSLLVPKDYVI